MIDKNIQLKSKDKKRVVAKALMDLNYSATEIAKLLEVDRSTVYRYNKQPTGKEMQQYATEIKTIFVAKQHQILAKILRKMEKLITKTDDLRALIVAFKTIKEHTESFYDIYRDSEHTKKWDSYAR